LVVVECNHWDGAVRIVIETISHNRHRYSTVGDWTRNQNGDLHILVSDMGNDDYAFLVGIHETVEAWLCERQGVTDEAVTAFDTAYEANRPEGDESEPGDDPAAPYSRQHNLRLPSSDSSVPRLACHGVITRMPC
jgi:hypothetical protein